MCYRIGCKSNSDNHTKGLYNTTCYRNMGETYSKLTLIYKDSTT